MRRWLLALTVILLGALPAWASPALVQSQSGTSGGTSVAATFGVTPTSGNRLILCVGSRSDGVPVLPAGWTIRVQVDNAAEVDHVLIADKVAGAGEPATITLTGLDAGGASTGLSIMEWADLAAGFDVAASTGRQAAVTAIASGTTASTSQASTVAIVCAYARAALTGAAWGGSYTTQHNLTANTDTQVVSGWKINASQGAQSSTLTWSSPATIAMAAITAYKAGPPDTQAPTDPSNLTCAGPTSSVGSSSWTASTDNVGVDHYNVRWCQGAGCTPSTITAQPSAASVVMAGLSPNTVYRLTVQAVDGAGNTSNPTAPCQLTTLPLTTLKLHWTDLSSDEAGFAINQCEPAYPATSCDPTTAGTTIATVGAGVVDFTWSSLAPTPVSCSAVKAQKSGAPDSGFTNMFCSAGGNPPVPPDNLSIAGLTAPLLSWRDLSTDETGFKVFERIGCGSGSYSLLQTTAANVTGFLVTPDPVEPLRQYRLAATNAVADSAFSNEACWSRWKHSGLTAPATHGTDLTPPPHGSLP